MASVKKIAVIIFLGVVSSNCAKVNNSSSLDAEIYRTDLTGSAAFFVARSILSGSCFNCHSAWASYNEADFVSNGLVVRGTPNDSILYTSIRGNDSGVTGTMPLSGTDLSSDQMGLIKSWIQSF